MGVRYDFRDVDVALGEAKGKVARLLASEGEKTVHDAIESGNYRDQSGRLRTSNRYEASSDGIMLINDAPYASFVESKGYEVLSGSFLRMVKRIEDNDNDK